METANQRPAAEETAALASSLSAWLAPVNLDGLTSQQTTALLTERVAAWARSQGWSVQFEVPSRAIRTGRDSREWRGRLDVVCSRDGGQLPVAIEIDRRKKLWSLDKLATEAAAGSVALWVRWHGSTDVDVPANVGLVDVAALASSRPPGSVEAVSAEQVGYLIRMAHRTTPARFTTLFSEAVRGTDIAPRRDGELFRDAIDRLSMPTARRLIGLLRQAERRSGR